MRIYVASSWRNEYQPSVVLDLRDAGHEVYDFRQPTESDTGFSWSEIDEDWQRWSPEQFVEALQHPTAERGYLLDFNAMQWADACVLVMPCGRSAHLEAGWFAGACKPLMVLLPPDTHEPELMYKLAGFPPFAMHTSMQSLLSRLQQMNGSAVSELRKQFA